MSKENIEMEPTLQEACDLLFNEMDIDKEKKWLTNLILLNKKYDDNYQEKWGTELINFASFFSTMLSAFPLGLLKRNFVRKNKELSFILQFPELKSVRNNIEKGSFAYDTLLFKQPAFRLIYNKSHLANLVCLAILFGDEFIDGLANVCGKQAIQRILQDETIHCDLQFKWVGHQIELYYAFDIREVLNEDDLQSINEKYGITYFRFYDHLLFLLNEINKYLNKLQVPVKKQAAQLICKICNNCFDTYRMDITEFSTDYSLQDIVYYFKKKDDHIIRNLLELRAVLLNKNTGKYIEQFNSWSMIVHMMQVYDDMEDAPADLHYQMNFLCYFAHRFYKHEWLWLQQEASMLRELPAMQRNFMISIHMPQAVIACNQYSRHIVLKDLSWVQKKIAGYLWKKNRLGWGNKKMNATCDLFQSILEKPYTAFEKVSVIVNYIFKYKDQFHSKDHLYAHLLETTLLDPDLKKHLFKFLGKKEAYLLSHHFFDFPIGRKAALTRKWITFLKEQNKQPVGDFYPRYAMNY
ncbi:MAG: hypothetical protein JSS67_07415 [Bacteroidetes bacterium]|nr:hypothetical protein [Bacteroidota bacterium]